MTRPYQDSNYDQLKELYQHSEWFGGQFDEARDSREKLARKITDDPEAILVYEQDGQLLGTISLIEDGRVAWLFRFAVKDNDQKVAQELYTKATKILKSRGHTQVLVYTPLGNQELNKRYKLLGMTKGNNFTAFWSDLAEKY